MLGTSAPADPGGAPARSAAASRPHDERGALTLGLIENTIDRLEEAVEQETAALQSRAGVDLKEFNDRKSQGLLELTRVMRHIDGAVPEPALVKRLAKLRARLEVNSAALKLHLEAVREVSAAMADAMRDADSDGTYSRSIPARGKRS